MLIYGINPVLEALRAGRVTELRVSERAGGRIADLLKSAVEAGVRVRRVQAADLDRAAKGGVHQGAVAEVDQHASLSVEDLVAQATGPPLIVVLDGVEDPHNVGA